MRRALAAVLLAAVATTATAAPRPRAAAIVADDITVSFPSSPGGSHALVDVGSMGAAPRAGSRGAVRRERVLVRLERPSGAPGFARLRAFLAADPGGLRVRVDGVLLSTVPQLVDANAPIGPSVVRTVEIEVPASEPPGPVSVPITWLADAS